MGPKVSARKRKWVGWVEAHINQDLALFFTKPHNPPGSRTPGIDDELASL
jgi:hypothetical protein